MISTPLDPERAVTNIYNSAIAAAAIPAAWEVGLLDAVMNQKIVDTAEFAAKQNLDHDSMLGLAVVLGLYSVLDRDKGIVMAGSLFDEVYKTKSLFHWLTLGSGGLFCRLQYLLRNENRHGDYYQRDPVAIAFACREISHRFFDPTFWKVIHGLDYNFCSVVDLGCGSGERLMQILERYQGTTAIGIDIAHGAVSFAQTEAQARALEERLSLVVGDVRNLTYRGEFAQVDLLTCFMMGHDFWPRENCIVTLRKLRKAFPKVRRFILGDVVRSLLQMAGSRPPIDQVTQENVPMFNLGFELGHALMNTYIPRQDAWHGVFAEGGWLLVREHEIPNLANALIFELKPLDEVRSTLGISSHVK